tara:strand:+ start:418 stop:531 length:114 start_codon:yes stop_codon:yes gene_type:complete
MPWKQENPPSNAQKAHAEQNEVAAKAEQKTTKTTTKK